MAFIVEDGTGKVNANSLVSVEFAKAYFTERNVTTFEDLDTEVQTASLIKATDYHEMRWGNLLSGLRMYPDNPQALSFPRIDSSGVAIGTPIYDTIDPTLIIAYDTPLAIKKAICEYAIRASAGDLIKDVASDSIVSQRVKIGLIEKETNFTSNSKRPETFNSYPIADMLIKPYLKTTSGAVIR